MSLRGIPVVGMVLATGVTLVESVAGMSDSEPALRAQLPKMGHQSVHEGKGKTGVSRGPNCLAAAPGT